MSWTASGRYEADGDLDKLTMSPPPVADPDARRSPSAPEAQFEAAKDAAQEIIDSGNVGDGPYQVSLSGHAPTNRSDFAYKSVTVTVAQTTGLHDGDL